MIQEKNTFHQSQPLFSFSYFPSFSGYFRTNLFFSRGKKCSTLHFGSEQLSPSAISSNSSSTTTASSSSSTLSKMTLTKRQRSFLNAFIAGGGAGALSRTVTAPLARVKVILQVQAMSDLPQTVHYSGLLDALKNIPREEGIRALFKGNLANVSRAFPNAAIKFTAFELYKEKLFPEGVHQYHGVDLFARKLASGGLAGFSTMALTYPLDVVRTRLSADRVGVENSIAKCFRRIWTVEGFAGLYRGIGVSLCGIVPTVAISLTTYEELKKLHPAPTSVVFVPCQLLTGATAGVLAQTLLYPVDTVRRRMQMTGALRQATGYPTALSCFVRTLRNEGFVALYRGVGIAVLKAVPGAAVYYTTYDNVKTFLSLL
eukprot:GCRY01001750.1.p1 GENE.GCRY01001750.1~~GCRY01001750.1.p1  ORF type:complete len:372 (-),score=104.59 GCRY01001750.1:386-1501(-)